MVAAQRKSFWEKHRLPDIFRSRGICRWKERSRRWRATLTLGGRGQGWVAPPVCVEASCLPSVSSSGFVCLLVK
jgi:hypothetical protein